MSNDFHPPTHEIRVQYTAVNGNVYEQSHFVWDAVKFMQARFAECKEANETHLKETGKPGVAKVELL